MGTQVSMHVPPTDASVEVASVPDEAGPGGASAVFGAEALAADANAALSAGGLVTGIIPEILTAWEAHHQGITELIVVDSMHTRKRMMYEQGDAAAILPGGFGTLDELFEMLTWGQLGLHKKPVGLLNIEDYYEDLLCMVNSMARRGFLKEENRNMLLSGRSTEDLLRQMRNYTAPVTGKWIRKENT